MSTQIKWGGLAFKVDGAITHGIDGFQAALTRKSDSSKSKKALSEAETISFTITSCALLGGSPVNDYDYLKSFVGFKKKLSVNNGFSTKLSAWRAGGAKFILDKVELTDTEMDNFGRIITAEIKLSFIEDGTKNTGSKKKVKKKIRKPAKKIIGNKWKK